MRMKKAKIILTYDESHRYIAGVLEKLCNRCEKWFPCDKHFYYINNKNKQDGFYPYCKLCAINKQNKWSNDNYSQFRETVDKHRKGEKAKQKDRRSSKKRRENGKFEEWLNNNKERQSQYAENRKKKKHEISDREWDDCRIYFNFRCAYCGKTWEQNKLETRRDLHKEHVDDEGKNDLSNCIPSCRDCNSYKWKYSFDEFYHEANKDTNYSIERHEKILNWLNVDYARYIRKPIN
jgi:hypothetical protein